MNGNIFNGDGILVGVVIGPEIFGITGKKLYNLKGSIFIGRPVNWSVISMMREVQREAAGSVYRSTIPHTTRQVKYESGSAR